MLSKYRVRRARSAAATLVVAGVAVLVMGCAAALAREPSSVGAPAPSASVGLLARGAGYDQVTGSQRVRALQSKLRRLRHDPGPIDGLFGPRTEAAVRGFQQSRGLAMDGIVGEATAAALRPASHGVRQSDGGRRTAGSSPARSAAQHRRPLQTGQERGVSEPAAQPTRSKPVSDSGSVNAPLAALVLALGALVALTVVLFHRRRRATTSTPGSIVRASRARIGEFKGRILAIVARARASRSAGRGWTTRRLRLSELRGRMEAVAARVRRSPPRRRRRIDPRLWLGELRGRIGTVATGAGSWRPAGRRRRDSAAPMAGPQEGLRFRADPGDGGSAEREAAANGREPAERRVPKAAPSPAPGNGNGPAAAEVSGDAEQVTSGPRSTALSRPGEKVGLGCFHLGRLSDGSGAVWQYMAIDLASGYVWAEVQITEHKPRAGHMRELVQRVGRELRAAGWRLESLSPGNAAQLAEREFRDEVEGSGARCRGSDAGPAPNGELKRVHQTIVEECWRPASVRSRPVTLSVLQRDLDHYLKTYNWRRVEPDGRVRDRAPGDILGTPRGRASNGAAAVASPNAGGPKRSEEHNLDGSGGTVDDQRSARP